MPRRSKRSIPFYKMSGSGNDFILIDNRRRPLKGINLKPFIKQVCRHHTSVGGDGLIILEPSQSRLTHFRFRLFNSDGGEAELSGNGGRCAARLAYLIGMAPKQMVFESLAGLVNAEVNEKKKGHAIVKIEMPIPKNLELKIKIPVKGRTLLGHHVNTGVPHTVLFMKNLDNLDVAALGKMIRYHPLFQPAGTNVDFAMLKTPRQALMRSYERGVEEETLACGTGAVAVSLVASVLGLGRSPMTIRQGSGMPLRVTHQRNGKAFSQVFLEGDAQLIVTGEIQEEAWGPVGRSGR